MILIKIIIKMSTFVPGKPSNPAKPGSPFPPFSPGSPCEQQTVN